MTDPALLRERYAELLRQVEVQHALVDRLAILLADERAECDSLTTALGDVQRRLEAQATPTPTRQEPTT